MSFLDRFKSKDPSKEDIEALRKERLAIEERAKNRKEYYNEKDRISQAKKEVRANSGFNRAISGFRERAQTINKNIKAQDSKGKSSMFRLQTAQKQPIKSSSPFVMDARPVFTQQNFRDPFKNETTPKKEKKQVIRIVIDK